jgi:branched-chain amino acid transport system substrate-binding protein
MVSIRIAFFLLAVIVPPAELRADILIGAAGPFSGADTGIGDQLKRGTEQAVADLNAKGGLLGQKVKIFTMDDACDPKQAVSAANELAARGGVFVVGHVCSAASIAASEVYADADIVEITPDSTNPKFTERGLSTVFRTCGRDDEQGPAAARFVLERLPTARIAVVHDKTGYGKDLTDQFIGVLEQRHVKPVLYDAITAGEKDYSALVSKLKLAQADYLYFGGLYMEAGLITRQMRAQGLKTVLVGADGLATAQYWAITGTAGEGTLITFNADHRFDPGNQAVLAAFRADHYEPEGITLYSYAAVQAWAAAVQATGSTEGGKVAAALHAGSFDTLIGKIAFDNKGDVTGGGYVLYQWSNGRYEMIR